MRLAGGCHCGTVRFAIDVDAPLAILDCNCSICSLSAYLHLIVPHEKFDLICGRNSLTSYRFGSGKAEHMFCGVCGIKSFYQPRSHPESWSVHARCLDDYEALKFEVTPFDGRNWEKSATEL